MIPIPANLAKSATVIGVDPSITGTGFAVVRFEWASKPANATARLVYSETIVPPGPKFSTPARIFGLVRKFEEFTAGTLARTYGAGCQFEAAAIVVEDPTEQYLYRGKKRRASDVAKLAAATGAILGQLSTSGEWASRLVTVTPLEWYPRMTPQRPVSKANCRTLLFARIKDLPEKVKDEDQVFAAGVARWFFWRRFVERRDWPFVYEAGT